jgi:GTPase SAR1 family protein
MTRSAKRSLVRILLLGSTGAGKSSLGVALTEGQAPFEIGDGADAGTTDPTTFRYELPTAWASKATPPPKEGPNPANFTWELIDTPGLNDSEGEATDQIHLAAITQAIQTSPEPVNVIVLVMPFSPPRFDTAFQKTLKIIDAFFNDPQTWLRVCIVATRLPSKPRQPQYEAFTVSNPKTKCVRDKIVGLLHDLHDWRATDPEFPVFFVDSEDPHGACEREFIRFIQFASTCAMIPVDVLKIKVPDLRIMRSKLERRVITTVERSKLWKSAATVRAGQRSREIGTRSITRERTETRTVRYVEWVRRDVDALDIFTFGIARAARGDREAVIRYREESYVVTWEDKEPMYEIEYTHCIEMKITQQRTITWDFTAELPIDYHDNFDGRKAGRRAGPWAEVSRECSRAWDEDL